MKQFGLTAFLRVLLLSLSLFVAVGDAQQSKDLVMARSVETPGLPVYTGSHALIVGINKSPNLPKEVQLKYAVNDAKEMRDVLVDYYGFAESDVIILLDDKATLANIRTALDQLASRESVKSDDRILVYFSGHGQTVRDKSGNDRGFLIPSDGRVKLEDPSDITPYEQTCLPMQEVWNRLDPSPAKHIAVIADACFSGLLTRPRALDADESLSAYLTMSARQAISAGGRGQKTWETDEYKHGVFTYNLLNELRNRAKDKQRVFSMIDLFASIQDPVVRMSKGRQIPQYSPFFTEGQMLFFASGNKPVVAPKPPDDKPPVKTNPAKLTVKCDPQGATILVDGEEIGTAPLSHEFDLEKNKKVKVRAEMDGYEPMEKQVDLKPKKEAKVDFKLKKKKEPEKPKQAFLKVTSFPSGAKVFVNGDEAGTTPFSGTYEGNDKRKLSVRLELAGFEPQTKDVEVVPTKESTLHFDLVKEPEKPRKATLTITSEPTGARVFVDGIEVGKTPYTVEKEIVGVSTLAVKVALTGYQSEEQTGTLDPNQPGTLAFKLKKNAVVVPPVSAGVRFGVRSKLAFNGTPVNVQFSPDGSKLALTDRDNTIHIFDSATGTEIRAVKESESQFVRLSSDWKSLIFISVYFSQGRSYASVLAQDFDNPKSGRVFAAPLGSATAVNYAVAQNGVLVLCGQSPDGASIAIVNLATGKSDAFAIGGKLQGATVSADGQSVAVFRDAVAAGIETNLLLMRGANRDDQQRIPISDSNVGQHLYFSPDGDVVALNSGRRNGATQTQKGLKVFQANNGKLRFASNKHVAIGFVGDSRKLMAWSEAQGGTVELLDAVTGASLGAQKSARPWLSENGRWALIPTANGLQFVSVEALR